MDIRQLRYFIAIAESGSFSKAAHFLNVAQPSLSLHVKHMEDCLGTSLLFRSSTGVRPTEAGEVLLRRAHLIIEQFETAQREVRCHEVEPNGEVRVGLPSTISHILGVPLIIEVRNRYPKIKLRVAEAMSGFVLDWLRGDRIDFGLLYLPVQDRNLTCYRMLTEELWLCGPLKPPVSVCHPTVDPLPYADVARLPLVLPSPGHGLRDLLEMRAAASGLLLNTAIDVDAYANIKVLVEQGFGYSILPANAIGAEIREKRLLAWRVIEPALYRSVYLVHAADRPLSKAVTTVKTLCRLVLTRLVKEGKWNATLC